MKESKRQRQVGEMIRRHFGSVLLQEGSYLYGRALVTVTNVKMSSDLGQAKIYLSVFNTENKQEVMLMMDENIVPLRKALSQRIKKHVRRIPRIAFYIDDTVDEMYRIDDMFEKIDIPKAKNEEE
jgi:ribosome-binding factor A